MYVWKGQKTTLLGCEGVYVEFISVLWVAELMYGVRRVENDLVGIFFDLRRTRDWR